MLQVDDVTVSFGGIKALGGASLSAPSGQVTGLIGPNGAGKTTLFDVATGLRRPRSGRVHLNGRDVTRLGPGRRAHRGLARTFQRLEVFGSLSVRDNVLLAAEVAHGLRSLRRAGVHADEILDRCRLSALANRPAAELSTGTARVLEVARALATQPTTLLLDEPGSGLDEAESQALGDLLLDVAAEGTAVLLVEHDVAMVMRVCTSITVLDFGRVLAEGTPAQIQADPRVQQAYLGTAAPGVPAPRDAAADQEVTA